MKIADNAVVSLHYVLTSSTGEQLDASDRGPLHYLHGHSNIIPGLEQALGGREVGDSFAVEIAPEEAYGARNDELVQTVPRSAFEGIDKIEPGMQFQAQTPAGAQLITVSRVEGDAVTVDANHPLAGETLHFQVQVVEIREATPQEIEHGHAHGPSGHDH